MKTRTVLWCSQCEGPLPAKCEKCTKHPDRKPRIVEIFGIPEIVENGPCGCVRFRCQRPGCGKTRWAMPKADGTMGFKNCFCSRQCTVIVTNNARKAKRVTAVCSCGCGRTVTRPASNMRSKQIYFSTKCHYVHRIAMKSKARREAAESIADVQAYSCYSPRCRGEITDHTKTSIGVYSCVRCNLRGPEPSSHGIGASAKVIDRIKN